MKSWLGLLVGVLFCALLLVLGMSQEVPIGVLKGRITMKENGKPLPETDVRISLVGPAEEDRPDGKATSTDDAGLFSFRNVPAGDYKLRISASNHEVKTRRVTIEEGKTLELNLVAEPSEPHLAMYASQSVFSPKETPHVELTGFTRGKPVQLTVHRLPLDQLAAQGGDVRSLVEPFTVENLKVRPKSETVLHRTEPLTKMDAEGGFVETIDFGTRPEGIYFAECVSGETRAVVAFTVSSIALITKSGREKTLCYASDLVSGQPVGDVEVFRSAGNGLQSAGKTNAEGLLSVGMPSKNEYSAGFLARKGNSVALVGFLNYQPVISPVWMYVYCERPAYRPGDTVYFKGVVRKVDGDGYRLPGMGSATVTVSDPDGNEYQRLTLPISEHGSFTGSFSTSKEGKPGGYALSCKALGGEYSGAYANVVAYRKPEFSITVKPVKPSFVAGDRAQATVECQYYYGGPVVGATVRATIYRSPAFRYANEDGEDENVSSYGGGEYSEEVEVKTDAAGRALVEFDTRAENDPPDWLTDYEYTISASVTEDDSRYFDGEGQVLVTRGAVDVSASIANPILAPGQSADLRIKVTDAFDRRKPLSGQEVVVEVGREKWSDNNVSEFLRDSTLRATTGPDGTARVDVPVRRSEGLSLRVWTRDAGGRKVSTEEYAYVEGSAARRDTAGDLSITLDKRSYADADQAKVLLQTDSPGGSVLLCVQTDRVLWKSVVELTSGTTVVHVPVLKEYAPNVYLSAVGVRKKHLLQAEKRLNVSREDRRLLVKVTSDREVYHPGDTPRIRVTTTDTTGKAVPAEVSVGVVDAGIYAVASDSTDIYNALYPELGYSTVRTNYSFPEIYLDGGDKGSSKVPLRTKFRDTAGWLPTVWTGPTGIAEVSVPLPDNLTEWRVTAVGLSESSLAGMTTLSFRAKKDLMVRLQPPQYMVEGDTQRMTVVVANDTGTDQDVNIEWQSQGISLDGETKRVVRVKAGEPMTLDTTGTAGTAGDAKVAVRAWINGGESDGVQQSIPIHAHGRPILETRAGEGELDATFTPGAQVDPKYGTVRVTLSPTLISDLVRSLDSLIGYPYGCVEQTMSRFVPSVLVAKTVERLKLPRPKSLTKLPGIVRDSLARLSRMQSSEGGWGWWENDKPEPFMTALVLDGLDRARSAGYDVSAARPKNAINWALAYLKSGENKPTLRDKSYLTYALLRWKQKEAAKFLQGLDLTDRSVQVVAGTFEMTPRAADLATAAMAFREAGRAAAASSALDQLMRRAVVGEETVTWAASVGAWGDEPTALALTALLAVRPNDPAIPKIVRGLMRSRRADQCWHSTRDTAYALIGLTTYAAQTSEMTGESVVRVLVNGKERAKVAMSASELEDPARTITVPIRELAAGPIHVQIDSTGSGKRYYSVAINRLETSKELVAKATDNGLRIERRMYRMEARRLENGNMKLLPITLPVESYENGDLVRVELLIHSDVPREFVLIEEPTPSSCRVTEREDLAENEEWSWWWSRTIIRDDRIAFFARNLPAGESRITYNMRAEQAGQTRGLPATMSNMYDPGRWASSAESHVEVRR